MFTVEDVPKKGKGLIASRNIPKGTRIICERPVITAERIPTNLEQLLTSIEQQVNTLNNAQKEEFLSLSNVHPCNNFTEMCFGIVRTNGLSMGLDPANVGIFITASRINHACDPNALKFYNENLGQLTIHASKDISEGEEITVPYMMTYRDRRRRQAILQETFNFLCSCQLCCLPPNLSKVSDRRLDRISDIERIMTKGGVAALLSSPRRMLQYANEQVRLLSKPSLDTEGLALAYCKAFNIAVANGDLSRARIFAERGQSLVYAVLGADGNKAIKFSELAQDPSAHRLYGASMRWKTAFDQVPQELDPEKFEDWLWKRKNEKTGERNRVGLHDREAFPCFLDLLNVSSNVESDYFEYYTDGYRKQPARHWCFLAEIRHFQTSIFSQLFVKDVDGAIIILQPHPICTSALTEIQNGYTVAILYPVRRSSQPISNPILHLENPHLLKVGSQIRDKIKTELTN